MDFTNRKSDTVTKVRTETITFRMPSTIMRTTKRSRVRKNQPQHICLQDFLKSCTMGKIRKEGGTFTDDEAFLKRSDKSDD